MQTPGSAGTSLGGGSPQAWRLALRLHPSSGVRTGRVRGPALSFPLTLLHHHPAHKALLFYCVSVCASPCRWAPAQVGPAHRPLSPRAARAGRKVLSSLPSGRRALSLGGGPLPLAWAASGKPRPSRAKPHPGGPAWPPSCALGKLPPAPLTSAPQPHPLQLPAGLRSTHHFTVAMRTPSGGGHTACRRGRGAGGQASPSPIPVRRELHTQAAAGEQSLSSCWGSIGSP